MKNGCVSIIICAGLYIMCGKKYTDDNNNNNSNNNNFCVFRVTQLLGWLGTNQSPLKAN